MKPYGAKRRDCAQRFLKGTSRPCPCCIPKGGHMNHRSRARQKAISDSEYDCESDTELFEDEIPFWAEAWKQNRQ
jgi:hypothetical protein